MTIHFFTSTGNAYDCCQCKDDIKDGDVLVVIKEGVIGIAGTWPVAVTVAHGNLHTPAPSFTFKDDAEKEVYRAAVDLCYDSDLDVNPIIETLLSLTQIGM